MSSVVLSSDPVFLYNVTQQLFLAEPVIQFNSDTNSYQGIPFLTKDIIQCGILRICDSSLNAKTSLYVAEPVYLRIVARNLGINTFVNVIPGQFYEPGQKTVFSLSNHNTQWMFIETQQNTNRLKKSELELELNILFKTLKITHI